MKPIAFSRKKNQTLIPIRLLYVSKYKCELGVEVSLACCV